MINNAVEWWNSVAYSFASPKSRLTTAIDSPIGGARSIIVASGLFPFFVNSRAVSVQRKPPAITDSDIIRTAKGGNAVCFKSGTTASAVPKTMTRIISVKRMDGFCNPKRKANIKMATGIADLKIVTTVIKITVLISQERR